MQGEGASLVLGVAVDNVVHREIQLGSKRTQGLLNQVLEMLLRSAWVQMQRERFRHPF